MGQTLSEPVVEKVRRNTTASFEHLFAVLCKDTREKVWRVIAHSMTPTKHLLSPRPPLWNRCPTRY